MELIVGLGNPGREYEGTRHNIGAEVVELLAERAGISLKRKWRMRAWVGEGVIADRRVVLARPRVFMNLSGPVVAALLKWKRCPPEGLLVVSDDIYLEPGRMRIRREGGAGGHRGLESVIAALKTENFARLRVGVGHTDEDITEHVLGRFSKRERRVVGEAVEKAARAVEEILAGGFDAAMNDFNR